VHDPLIRQVLARTEVVPDAELNRLYPAKFPARVTITLDDGTKLTETVLLPKGDPGAPLSDDELEAKYRDNAEPLLGKVGAAALRDAIWRLDDAPDVAELVRCMRPS
jgi:2-methylcitrate dehydratase